jgi:UDP-2,3-diacylglucosamine pyrophosphatase LpxH
MEAESDGFTLTFTEAAGESAGLAASYSMQAWTYILQSKYGSPEVDQAKPIIKSATLSEDKKSVRLVIDGLVRGHVHHLKADKVKSAKGMNLWHPNAYYTLNNIPE